MMISVSLHFLCLISLTLGGFPLHHKYTHKRMHSHQKVLNLKRLKICAMCGVRHDDAAAAATSFIMQTVWIIVNGKKMDIVGHFLIYREWDGNYFPCCYSYGNISNISLTPRHHSLQFSVWHIGNHGFLRSIFPLCQSMWILITFLHDKSNNNMRAYWCTIIHISFHCMNNRDAWWGMNMLKILFLVQYFLLVIVIIAMASPPDLRAFSCQLHSITMSWVWKVKLIFNYCRQCIIVMGRAYSTLQ